MENPTLSGRYSLRSQLGKGGMAVVLRAFDTRLQVERAIKLLQPHLSMHEQIRSRFETEASTMAKLHHRHIVTIYDIANDDNMVYMVMELLSGGSLMDRVERHGVLHPRHALMASIDMCKALDHAHQNNVIHRDVKPHNVLISSKGIIKVTDFGIARIEDGNTSVTRTGAVMGTVAYMAPEMRISATRASASSDLYAVAASLYVLLTNESPLELFNPRVQERVFPLLDPDIAEFLAKGCHPDPDDRFNDSKDMIKELESILPNLPKVDEQTIPVYIPGDYVAPQPTQEDMSRLEEFLNSFKQKHDPHIFNLPQDQDNLTIGFEQFVDDDASDSIFFPEEDEVSNDEVSEQELRSNMESLDTAVANKDSNQKNQSKEHLKPNKGKRARHSEGQVAIAEVDQNESDHKRKGPIVNDKQQEEPILKEADSSITLDNEEDFVPRKTTKSSPHKSKKNTGLFVAIGLFLLIAVGVGLWAVLTIKKNNAKKSGDIEMIRITKGTFGMGGWGNDPNVRSTERPYHEVTITRDFLLSRSEVTQMQWRKVMGSSPAFNQGCDHCPVENVTWFEIIEFINALSEKEGLEKCYSLDGEKVVWLKKFSCMGYRLPTEAEWEYAARALQQPTNKDDIVHSFVYSGSENTNGTTEDE